MMNLTLRVEHHFTRPKNPNLAGGQSVPDTETICDINEQMFSPRMLAAALRELADEVSPRREEMPF